MPSPTQIILYVADPERSAAFYRQILEKEYRTLSPNFVVFEIQDGFQLGLFRRSKLEPAAPEGISGELCFICENKASLEAMHESWRAKGAKIILPPTLMYFGGVNFIATDPDGNRLRASTPDK
jgi:predicted enzyme related to lactoylglutathione lyase